MKQGATKPLLFFVILSFFILTSICGCSNTEPVVPKIAIVEDRPQEWADAMKSGFRDGLIERGVAVGAEVTIESYSAAGDPQALSALADSLSQGQYVLSSRAERRVCAGCGTREDRPLMHPATASPSECSWCNP